MSRHSQDQKRTSFCIHQGVCVPSEPRLSDLGSLRVEGQDSEPCVGVLQGRNSWLVARDDWLVKVTESSWNLSE